MAKKISSILSLSGRPGRIRLLIPISIVHNNPKMSPRDTFLFCKSSVILSFNNQSNNTVMAIRIKDNRQPNDSDPIGQEYGRYRKYIEITRIMLSIKIILKKVLLFTLLNFIFLNFK
jgi:hypothetical protein